MADMVQPATTETLSSDDAAWESMLDGYPAPYVEIMGVRGDDDDHTLDGHFTLAQLELIVRVIKKRMAESGR